MVLMSGRLTDLPLAIEFGKRSLRAIRQNLFLSLCCNAIGIPLAAGAVVWAGIFLPPPSLRRTGHGLQRPERSRQLRPPRRRVTQSEMTRPGCDYRPGLILLQTAR